MGNIYEQAFIEIQKVKKTLQSPSIKSKLDAALKAARISKGL